MPPAPQPDPARGVFETLLVLAGRPLELDAHLARLAVSLRQLFAAELGEQAREEALAAAAPLRLGRLRLTARPGPGGEIELETSAAEVEPASVFPAPDRAVALRSVPAPGGLGAHKWADRSWLAQVEADAPGELPLLIDAGDEVLEASRANVFAVRDGTLLTPPCDGRILAGVARARVLELAAALGIEARERPIALAELLGAEEVFLSGSVRGVEPAGSLDGAALQPPGELAALIAAELRGRWLGRP